MLYRRTTAVASTVLAAVIAGVFSGASAQAQPASTLTYEAIGAMSLADQNALLDPLRAAADALDVLGRGKGAGVYAGVVINAPARSVDLYVTDTKRADEFLAHARTAGRGVNLSMVVVKPTAHTRRQLEAARDRIAASLSTLPVEVDNANVPADGSELVLGVAATPGFAPASQAARSTLASVAGVPVRVVPGKTLTGTDRFGDTAPFDAGDFITNAGWDCTTGLPVQNSSGHQYIVTASHYGHTGTVWKTGRGATVGTVVNYSEQWDAALIDGLSEPWEMDGPPGPTAQNRLPLTSTAYSRQGDLVCQDGYTTGVSCSIEVDDEDAQNFHVRGNRYGNTFSARGVTGHQVNGGIGDQEGDSGGLVFRVNADGTRQVRGIVSAGIDGTGNNGIFWTEALDIYNKFGVHLTGH